MKLLKTTAPQPPKATKLPALKTKKAFTIIEVSLAMTFLSVLLITVAMLTIHITATYQKGLSIKAITSTGRELIDEFSRAISSSPSKDASLLCREEFPSGVQFSGSALSDCIADNANKLTVQVNRANLTALGLNSGSSVPVSGAFCTGSYSYIWNSGYVLNPKSPDAVKNLRASYDGNDSVRLLKISDAGRNICKQQIKNNDYNNPYSTGAWSYSSSTNLGTPEEILSSSEDNLALYTLDIFKPTQHSISHRFFYSGTFTLATVQGGIDITSAGDYCKDDPSLNLSTDFNYCAINKFNFAMRATGENKS